MRSRRSSPQSGLTASPQPQPMNVPLHNTGRQNYVLGWGNIHRLTFLQCAVDKTGASWLLHYAAAVNTRSLLFQDKPVVLLASSDPIHTESGFRRYVFVYVCMYVCMYIYIYVMCSQVKAGSVNFGPFAGGSHVPDTRPQKPRLRN